MTLSDVIGKSLKWKPFNGTWLNGKQKATKIKQILLSFFLKNSIILLSPTQTLNWFTEILVVDYPF